MPIKNTEVSRRERIVAEVRRRLADIQEGQPVSDPYRITFGVVTRGSPLEGIHSTYRFGCAVIDTDEQKLPKINQMDSILTVVVEFAARVDVNEEPSEVGNRVMTDIQRKMREDLNLTEPDDPDDTRPALERALSENVIEVRNQLFIDGFDDRKITGAVFFNVLYKHAINDPRTLVSSLA